MIKNLGAKRTVPGAPNNKERVGLHRLTVSFIIIVLMLTSLKLNVSIMLHSISRSVITLGVVIGGACMEYSGGPMTEAMYYVLLALINPNHGYSLMNEIKEVSDGRVDMGPGTLYGVIKRIQKEGLIELKEDDGRKKIYSITKLGRDALQFEYNRLLKMVYDGIVLKEGDKFE